MQYQTKGKKQNGENSYMETKADKEKEIKDRVLDLLFTFETRLGQN